MFAKCFEILHQTALIQVQSTFSMKRISRSCTNLFMSVWQPDLQPEVVREKIPADFKVYQIEPAGHESWFSRQVPQKRAGILPRLELGTYLSSLL